MRLPEFLFPLINAMMRALLRSPLHAIASGSLMLITFRGRKSGRLRCTPVRYVMSGSEVRCFSSRETRWWRNLRGGAAVSLRIRGTERRFQAQAWSGDPATIRPALLDYLRQYPQDAAYHHVRLQADGTPFAEELERAVDEAVLVVCTPVD